MDAAERALLRETAEAQLRSGSGAGLVADLCESGLAAAIWDDVDAWSTLIEVQGGLAAMSPLVELLVLRDRYVDGCRLVVPIPGSEAVVHAVGSGEVTVDGLLVGADDTRHAAVVTDTAGSWQVSLDDLERIPAHGIDDALGLYRVRGTTAAIEVDLPASTINGRRRVAVGYELIGLGSAAQQVAMTHTGERRQFGRPIATFQVVAHRLAQVAVELSGARALLRATSHDPTGLGPLAASILAARAASAALSTAQQVCGAMGFTAEFGLHRLVRRGLALDGLIGGSENGPEQVAELVAAQGVPRLSSLSSL